MNDLYFECSSGISGDMAVAALLDLGADKVALQNALDSIDAQGFKTEIKRVNKSGIDCCDFNVILDSAHENHDHDMHYLFGHEEEHHHSDAEQHVILSESEESVDDKICHFEKEHRHSEQSEESVDKEMFRFAQHDETCYAQHDENSSQYDGICHNKSVSFTENQDSTNAKAFIYILTNFNKTTLYVGVTSDLKRRIYEHKKHLLEGFTNKYNCETLVYFECFEDIKTAIEREKYLKGKKRDFKENLINSINPNWQDLYDYIFKDVSSSPQHDEHHHSDAEHHVILSESEESVDKEMFRFAQHDNNFAQHDEHHHEEHEHHHHEHRNLSDVLAIIEKTQMTCEARKLACKIFEIIAQAESVAHNLSVDKVHFHEVGALDSIVDVIAFAVCFDSLKINRVFVPILNEGTGTVRCQHGILPIPVPAVSNIVQKYELPLHIMAEKGEFITPTGAAFVAAVMTDKVLPLSFTIKKIGLGAGKRTYERPSILRAFLIEETATSARRIAPNASETALNASAIATNISDASNISESKITKLETNIDDCTSETLGFVMEKLLEQGALEVNYIPCFMKKNRPSYLLTVICTENSRSKLEEIIFQNTTTIGIRRSVMQRTILNRKELELESPYGEIRAKEVWGFGVKRILPEYDDVAKIAQESKKSFLEIYSELAYLCKIQLNSSF